jgi:hypothetical protein
MGVMGDGRTGEYAAGIEHGILADRYSLMAHFTSRGVIPLYFHLSLGG